MDIIIYCDRIDCKYNSFNNDFNTKKCNLKILHLRHCSNTAIFKCNSYENKEYDRKRRI